MLTVAKTFGRYSIGSPKFSLCLVNYQAPGHAPRSSVLLVWCLMRWWAQCNTPGHPGLGRHWPVIITFEECYHQPGLGWTPVIHCGLSADTGHWPHVISLIIIISSGLSNFKHSQISSPCLIEKCHDVKRKRDVCREEWTILYLITVMINLVISCSNGHL